jgi:phosphate transport system substrate-binding protein
MFERTLSILSAILCLSVAAGIARADDNALRLGGSTTLVPVVSDSARAYMDAYKSWKDIDASMSDKPVVIYVTGGGSSFGVKSAIDGTVEIGMASRDLKSKEIEALGEHEAHLVGKDAVAFVARNDNPLYKLKHNLTSAELRKIFSGEYRTYDQIDTSLPKKEIVLLVRDAGAGSTEILQKVIMGKTTISDRALQMPSQGALLKKLEATPQALAYASSGLAMENKKLAVFELDGTLPSDENVVTGKYPMARPLLLIVKGKATPQMRHFIEYVLTTGQKSVVGHGFVPVSRQFASAK